MELTDKVKKTLKDNNIDYNDFDDIDYDEIYDRIIHKMKLKDFDKERLTEYFSLEKQLTESLNRKFVYLLIEKIKNNIDEFDELGQKIKDLDKDFLIDNIDSVLKNNNLDDLLESKEEERHIRLRYLEELVDKKYLYLLLEHLESL